MTGAGGGPGVPEAPPAIRRLPDALVNRIAAGEVVERPASAVKELVENAVDAGATRIHVTIRGAGRELVSVVDDGHGMAPADCRLALERHATSKLAGEEDLDRVATLGFRGEALASIFAVARLQLLSRPPAAPRGYRVAGAGGQIVDAGPVEAPPGTAIEIRDLFFNTPARAKFLKAPATEQGAILKVVTQMALARPSIAIRLTAGGRVLLAAPAARTLRERLGALYGFGLAERLVEVAGEGPGIRVGGLVGPPDLARSHREDLHVVVNGRAVRDAQLVQAVLEAYRPLLPRDQFPLAVLTLTLPADGLDVNVHPTKAWVRFRQPRLVQEAVHAAVRDVLRQADPSTGRLKVSAPPEAAGPVVPGWPGPTAGGPGLDDHQASLFRDEAAPYRASPAFGTVVGQVDDTFVVSHTPDEVFFIDQHVAHERILFERARDDLTRGPLAAQTLLFPEPLDLAPARSRALGALTADLHRLGFDVEPFGGRGWVVRAVPALLRDDEPRRLVDELARELPEEEGGEGFPVLDRLLAFVACRAAVKAGQPLAREAMAQLLTDLAGTANPFYCPHGRPVVSRIPLRDIRRELGRTW